MKICLVITGLTMGGAERQVCDLADQFASMGHDVLLVSLNKDPVVLPRSARVHLSHLFLKKTPPGLLLGFFQLRKAIRKFGPDIVHAHMIHANIMCRMLRIVTPMKVLICTAHNTNEGGKLRELLYRYTDRLNTVATNVTQEAVDAYIDKRISFPGRMIAVANGIDTQKFQFSADHRASIRESLDLTEESFLYLSVGRLEEQKDYANLIRAFSLVCERTTERPARLAIIGDGTLRAALASQVERASLSDRVVFMGNQFNVHEWMSACDAYVLSSAWEGFGLVVAEAMLCERVVVATDCGGVKEVLGHHGFLVPPRSPDLLAQGMHEAMHLDSETAAQSGCDGRTHVMNHYALEAVAKRWTTIYDGYLGVKS